MSSVVVVVEVVGGIGMGLGECRLWVGRYVVVEVVGGMGLGG